MKGSYVLIVHLCRDTTIEVGALGEIDFKAGYYAYSGSALNSLPNRINRHLRENKKIFWHIDYLLRFGNMRSIWIVMSGQRKECIAASHYHSEASPIERFGSSDCKCASHLFYHRDVEKLERIAEEIGYEKLSEKGIR